MAEWLLADVGASHTRVALATPAGLVPGTAQTFQNAGFPGLAPLLADYLAAREALPTTLCAGVAGPVSSGTAQLTNLDWFIDSRVLRNATGVSEVHLLNDLQAQAWALDDLAPESVLQLVSGAPDPLGPRLVMGLGTGSNIAVAHRLGPRPFVPPSEAGHSSLPHMDEATNALISALATDIPHKPYEALLSGPGLTRLHRLRTGTVLPPPEIVNAHVRGEAAATATLRVFARLLGTVLGNLALSHMATGGVFLIGGTARTLAAHLLSLGMRDCFTAKGPYTEILLAMPLTLIIDDHAAVTGCAHYLRQGTRPETR
ncbi:MAG: glucokinase [Rhodobacteraceae bacterium CG17_big_fil_post_rev_8_21_14_2_50_63_15]|nr:glucokinase [Roseovarius sp.]PIV77557.1 MAG: glucokinase [Rhodobacteraceae bacterium CG17_big_fil_post_rev_8_21_14_2_50_63_15]